MHLALEWEERHQHNDIFVTTLPRGFLILERLVFGLVLVDHFFNRLTPRYLIDFDLNL